MSDSISDEVRQTLQHGIRDVLLALRTASLQEKDALNDLMQFYRSMHSMSLQAMKIERKLDANRLPRRAKAARENSDLRQPRRNADKFGPGKENREPESARQGGTTHFILDFGRP